MKTKWQMKNAVTFNLRQIRVSRNKKARDRIDGMISFTSFPVQAERGSEYARHFPDDEDHMDLDDGDFEAGGSKITWPGETITSSQAFMRYG
jgi:hypothetical protein